jgi:hypothetical protein
MEKSYIVVSWEVCICSATRTDHERRREYFDDINSAQQFAEDKVRQGFFDVRIVSIREYQTTRVSWRTIDGPWHYDNP